MSGLRFNSLADMPEGMRQKVAGKLVGGRDLPSSVSPADCHFPPGEGKRKYGNVVTMASGIRFDSKKEAHRFGELIEAVRAGILEDLRLQVDFTLQEAYTDTRGQRVRAIRYKADFTYRVERTDYGPRDFVCFTEADLRYWFEKGVGAWVVEDVKSQGTRTKEYSMKKKLMADKGYQIREV